MYYAEAFKENVCYFALLELKKWEKFHVSGNSSIKGRL